MLSNLIGNQYSNRAMHNARSFVPHFQKSSSSMETSTFIQEPIEKFYEVGEEIGNCLCPYCRFQSGKFATVRKCKHKASGVEYAAKFIRKRRTKTSRRGAPLQDIKREVAILRQTEHENVAKLYEVYEGCLDIILILELVSGGELFNYLAEKDKVSEDEAVVFLKQILEGVQHLHSLNIIHLDLKPENLVLDGNDSRKLKIIDFGLSRKLEANSECRDITGTPEFVAPEVINYDPLSTATDMWSIGVITYIMLSGCSPFLGDDKQETLANASLCKYDFDEESFSGTSDLAKDFIQKLLIREPQKRLSATECLCHPWIKPQNEKHVLSRRISVLNVVNLKSFVARKRWKQSFHLVCLMNHLMRQSAVRKASAVDSTGATVSEGNLSDDVNTKDDKVDDDLDDKQDDEESDEELPCNARMG